MQTVKDRIAIENGVAEILLHGEIGAEVDGYALASDIQALRSEVDRIEIRINSPGGVLMEGISIYDAMQKAREKTEVVPIVEGVAASSAGIVALGGDRTLMSKYGLLMFHLAHLPNGAVSTAQQKMVDRFNDVITSMLQSNTEWDENKVRQVLQNETWFSATEAFQEGLIDEEPFDPDVVPEQDPAQAANIQQAYLVMNNAISKASALQNNGGQSQNPNPMTLSAQILNNLGLHAQADEASINEAINYVLQERDTLKDTAEKQGQKIQNLQNQVEELKGHAAAQIVDAGIEAGKLDANARDNLVEKAKADPDGFKEILDSTLTPGGNGSGAGSAQAGAGGQKEPGGASLGQAVRGGSTVEDATAQVDEILDNEQAKGLRELEKKEAKQSRKYYNRAHELRDEAPEVYKELFARQYGEYPNE